MLHRLSRIAIAARSPAAEPEAGSAGAEECRRKAVAAAAEAFTERKRANGLAA